LHQVEAGAIWWLTPEENRAVGEHNETFRSVDRVEELIRQAYDPDASPARHLSASEVLDEVGFVGAKVGDMRKAGVILRKLFATATRRGVTSYHMPYPLTQRRHLTPVRNGFADGPL
jgi:putative DNA primase/helicase